MVLITLRLGQILKISLQTRPADRTDCVPYPSLTSLTTQSMDQFTQCDHGKDGRVQRTLSSTSEKANGKWDYIKTIRKALKKEDNEADK